MQIDAIASAILNHIYSGTQGLNSNLKVSIEQLRDEVIAEKNLLLKQWLLQGVLNLEELYHSINCIEVDCDYISKCCDLQVGEKALHFEIPPIVHLNGVNTIKFIGSVDKSVKYTVYTDDTYRYHKYKKRRSNKPYVYVDTSINSNGNMDCYLFNAPLVKYISVVALFQDPRRLLEWDCCGDGEVYLDLGILSEQIINNLTQRYLYYYRQAAMPIVPNNQQPR